MSSLTDSEGGQLDKREDELSDRASTDASEPVVTTAAAQVSDGAMLALVPSDDDLARLALDGGEASEQLHLTIAYLGESAGIEPQIRAALTALVSEWAQQTAPIQADGFNLAVFNPHTDERDTALVMGVGGQQVDQAQRELSALVDEAGATFPEQHKPFVAHVTLAYTDQLEMLPDLVDRLGPITFDRARLAFGGEVTDMPLRGTDDQVTTAAAKEPYGDVRYADPGYRKDGVKRYPIDCGHVQAAWSYIHRTDNRRFYTAEQLRLMEGRIRAAMKRCGHDVGEDNASLETAAQEHDVDAPGGGHNLRDYWVRGPGAAKILWGTPGAFRRCVANLRDDVRDPEGLCAEYHHRATGKWPGQRREGSADVQAAVTGDCGCTDAAAAYDGPQGEPSADGECPQGQHRMPDGGCMPDEQMQQDLATTGETARWAGVLAVEGVETGDGRVYALGGFEFAPFPLPLMYQPANIGQHAGSVVVGRIDRAWRDDNKVMGEGILDLGSEYGAEVRRLMATPDDPGFLRGVSVDLDSIKEGDLEYVYTAAEAKPQDGGQPALLAQPDRTIVHRSRIRGATLVQFPAFVEAQVALVNDADTPTPGAGVLVASGHTITIPELPPAGWFAEPTDVTPKGALTVTDEGRVYGYLAPAGVAHRSFPDRRVEVPRGNVDYSRFLGGQTLIDGGNRVTTGAITMECGHADVSIRDANRRLEHYDNTCSVVASINIGENQHGVWVAGAIYPWVTQEQLQKMLNCRLSGDWITRRDGKREFVAALLVPVPGFAMPRQASVRMDHDLLIAAAVPVQLEDQPAQPDWGRFAALLAREAGLDPASQMAALATRMGLDELAGRWTPGLHPRGPGGKFASKPGATRTSRSGGGERVTGRGGRLIESTVQSPVAAHKEIEADFRRDMAAATKKRDSVQTDALRQSAREAIKGRPSGQKLGQSSERVSEAQRVWEQETDAAVRKRDARIAAANSQARKETIERGQAKHGLDEKSKAFKKAEQALFRLQRQGVADDDPRVREASRRHDETFNAYNNAVKAWAKDLDEINREFSDAGRGQRREQRRAQFAIDMLEEGFAVQEMNQSEEVDDILDSLDNIDEGLQGILDDLQQNMELPEDRDAVAAELRRYLIANGYVDDDELPRPPD